MKKEQGMWDVLIPLLIVIVILPWIVHLAIYSCGYAEYEWYAAEDVIADFFCYYKSYFLDVVAIFSAIILAFRLGLYKEKTKNMKIYIPLLVYGVFVMLSTIFSINPKASLQGNFESFESVLVLIAYIIMSVYAYQIMEYERDYKIIWYAIVGIGIAFSVMGILQVFGYDFMDFSWVQRLIMSKEEFEMYGGTLEDTFSDGYVYLTLYNPNYAGIVLAMLFVIVFVMCMTEIEKKKKIAYGILSAVLMILVWFTYARASLFAILMVLCYLLFLQIKSKRMKVTKKRLVVLGTTMAVVTGVFVCVDSMADFKYISRIFEQNEREPLESMTTESDGIHIRYADTNYLLWIEEDKLYCRNESTNEVLFALEGEEMNLPMENGAKAYYMPGDEKEAMIYLAETTLNFVQQEGGYFYKTPSGKITDMTQVKAADFHGLEYLGSARGYIWSRILPLLKDNLIIGSGPDTFPEIFPQNDYAGKIVYSDTPEMVIEKGHNDYLTKWIQTGFCSLICIVVFYIILFLRGKKLYQGCVPMDSFQNRIGYGCYLACIIYMMASFFNDSTLHTSPLFWVFAGIAFRSIMDER